MRNPGDRTDPTLTAHTTEGRVELSDRNRQIVSDFYAGVIEGAGADPARLFHPEVVVYEPHVLPWGGTFVGMEGQKDLAERQASRLEPSTLVVDALYADGDVVVSVLRIRTTGDGAEILLSEHMRLEDGLIVEQRVYVFGNQDRPLAEIL